MNIPEIYIEMMDWNSGAGIVILVGVTAAFALLVFALGQISSWSENRRLLTLMKMQERHLQALRMHPLPRLEGNLDVPSASRTVEVLEHALSGMPNDLVKKYDSFGGQIPATVAVRPNKCVDLSSESSPEPN